MEKEFDDDPFGVNDPPSNKVSVDYTYCDFCGWKLDFDCSCVNKSCKRYEPKPDEDEKT